MWREFIANFERWLKYTCYLALIGVGFDFLQYLPPHIADRLIEGLLSKLGV